MHFDHCVPAQNGVQASLEVNAMIMSRGYSYLQGSYDPLFYVKF